MPIAPHQFLEIGQFGNCEASKLNLYSFSSDIVTPQLGGGSANFAKLPELLKAG
jgi:hypothetical protein